MCANKQKNDGTCSAAGPLKWGGMGVDFWETNSQTYHS
jgi:hypothetical protein